MGSGSGLSVLRRQQAGHYLLPRSRGRLVWQGVTSASRTRGGAGSGQDGSVEVVRSGWMLDILKVGFSDEVDEVWKRV